MLMYSFMSTNSKQMQPGIETTMHQYLKKSVHMLNLLCIFDPSAFVIRNSFCGYLLRGQLNLAYPSSLGRVVVIVWHDLVKGGT